MTEDTVKLGYLLPTRENVMAGRPSGRLLLDAARTAADFGFDSLWAGDSLFARPRHDPLTLLAAVGAALPGVTLGTAVLLPALRNPVVLAQQLATIDQLTEGALIVGVGIAADAPSIRAEFVAADVPFEGRVGRLLEGTRLMRALWSGEAVDWTGRWTLEGVTLGPTPYTPGGPPIWMAAGVLPGLERTGRLFDGWLPIGPDPRTFGERRAVVAQAATAASRSEPVTGLYLTIGIDGDAERADARINDYLERYYGVPAVAMRRIQACFGGPLEEVVAFIRAYVQQGARHLVIRLVGDDHAAMLAQLASRRHAFDAS